MKNKSQCEGLIDIAFSRRLVIPRVRCRPLEFRSGVNNAAFLLAVSQLRLGNEAHALDRIRVIGRPTVATAVHRRIPYLTSAACAVNSIDQRFPSF